VSRPATIVKKFGVAETLSQLFRYKKGETPLSPFPGLESEMPVFNAPLSSQQRMCQKQNLGKSQLGAETKASKCVTFYTGGYLFLLFGLNTVLEVNVSRRIITLAE
jgi:hypothetical protein